MREATFTRPFFYTHAYLIGEKGLGTRLLNHVIKSSEMGASLEENALDRYWEQHHHMFIVEHVTLIMYIAWSSIVLHFNMVCFERV